MISFQGSTALKHLMLQRPLTACAKLLSKLGISTPPGEDAGPPTGASKQYVYDNFLDDASSSGWKQPCFGSHS